MFVPATAKRSKAFESAPLVKRNPDEDLAAKPIRPVVGGRHNTLGLLRRELNAVVCRFKVKKTTSSYDPTASTDLFEGRLADVRDHNLDDEPSGTTRHSS
ncbi:hypothetical protein ACA910_019414 [Epithemia clementina (nom. ined.)]